MEEEEQHSCMPEDEKSSLVKIQKEETPKTKRLSSLQNIQIGVMIFFMGLQLTLPYTISVYMVRDFFKGDGHSEQKIAQLTGILAASQSFFRTLSAYLWGILVDKLGRKIGPLAGIVGCIISLVMYGSSRNYTQALLARSLPALLISGCPVGMKAMIGDVCDEKGQALALGIFNLGHGLGSVVGPILGGAFSNPCDNFANFPFCGADGILQKRPFLLPCLIGAVVGGIAFLTTCFLFEETHPELRKQPGSWKSNFIKFVCCRNRKQEYSPIDEEFAEAEGLDDRRLLDSNNSYLSQRDTNSSLGQRESSNSFRQKDSDVEMGRIRSKPLEQESIPEFANGNLPEPTTGLNEAENKVNKTESRLQANGHSIQPPKSFVEDSTQNIRPQNEGDKWWKDRDTNLALIGSGLAAFFWNFFDEMCPIYVSAPVKEGGLAMPLKQFTWPLASAGTFLVVFSLLGYPWMIAKFSSKRLCQFGMVGLAPIAIMLPLASVFRTSYIAQQILVYLSVTLAQIPKVCAMGSSMVVLNLVASKAAMGRVNGAGVTLQSAGRALGPTLSGSIWAISVSLHLSGQQFLGFVLCLIGCVASQFVFAVINVPNSSR